MVMFAIQISTFLMTLRLKGIINNDTWHVLYSIALLMNMPIGFLVSNGRFCALLYSVFYMLRIHGKHAIKNRVVSTIVDNKYVAWSFILSLALLLNGKIFL